MSHALAHIADRVRERVRLDGVDLGSDEALAARYVRDEVQRYSERALGGSVPLLDDEAHAAQQIVATLTGITLTDADVRDLVERMLQHSGRRVDLSSPFVDANLPLCLVDAADVR